MSNEKNEPTIKELLSLAQETHTRTVAIDAKLDEQNQLIAEQNKLATRHGAIAGGIAGGLVATGIELIKAKFGF